MPQHIDLQVHTHRIPAGRPIAMAIIYRAEFVELDLQQDGSGWKASCDLPDEINSCAVEAVFNGPAFAWVEVYAKIPSRSLLGPIIARSVAEDEDNRTLSAIGVLDL